MGRVEGAPLTELRERLQKLPKMAATEFTDILREDPEVFRDRIRLIFNDESFMDIRYPINHDYSFHWQRRGEVYRINTAPHHPELETSPRHMHTGKEEVVKRDSVTSLDNPPEENLRRVLKW